MMVDFNLYLVFVFCLGSFLTRFGFVFLFICLFIHLLRSIYLTAGLVLDSSSTQCVSKHTAVKPTASGHRGSVGCSTRVPVFGLPNGLEKGVHHHHHFWR